MGNVRFGPPTDLIRELATRFSIDHFVETGTYLGGTSSWAASQFAHVWTSELHPDSYRRAKDNLARFPNVQIYHQPSPGFLRHVLPEIRGKALFWLDAHMMPGSVTAGLDDECPVLDEIRAILAWRPRDAFILIDDARLFLAPAALPHKADQWPAIRELLDAFIPLKDSHHIIIHNDVVMVIPLEARAFLVDHCQQEVTRAIADERRPTQMMLTGARQTARGMMRAARSALRWATRSS
jgi:hypothetical protein